MRRLSTLIAGLAIFILAAPLQSQQPELMPYVMVETFDVGTAQAEGFAEAIEHFKMAVDGAGVSAELPWEVYRQDTRWHLVLPMPDLTRFDPANEAAFMEMFAGTPGEAHLGQAMQIMSANSAPMTSELMLLVEDWTYFPTDFYMGSQTGASVFEAWVKVGAEETFNESTKDLFAMLTEMNYPYAVLGHRTLVGDGGKVTIVVLHDGLDSFYGANSLDSVASSVQMEAWGELMTARDDMVTKRNSFNVQYDADLSNSPGM